MPVRQYLGFELLKAPQNVESMLFGPKVIHKSQIFAKSRLSFAFTNIKPFAPGHSLVSPIRVVPRYKDLTPEEIYDWGCMVQVVAESLEKMYNCTSSSIIIQDGKEAGQTIPHLHAHIIPRKANDLEDPDSIYESVDNEEGTLRTMEEMEKTAAETEKFVKMVLESKCVGCLNE
ncbi:bis5'-nucleosyl-tri-or tetra- phosphatase, putative [Theileria equi strain WA]|uniref:Bis(5'-adenosyl)-triphosphatase n=1 Tax=Theileria equi strain WA TaxID=1537102 RepID=L1LBJ3_THEEQ|nr:bis5'-nucleosyl-tri-or tetra- phosphatase, putative [Theileria equi strain WA]EKX72644.1 bis5'-nucleosyl-tri-or tetra- phosphatase, putative [Theileria equi strain WA]|eukprot:XP_004832096.1 bis5'-nucleosyl-tri-or tetra- phosphatase, putative [Theileria equi strain WA]